MRGALWVLALMLAAGAGLHAEDFWEKKKYTDWTDKEVKQMMNNSPWARRVDLPMGGPMGGGRGGRGGGRRGGGGMSADSGFGGADSLGGGGIGGADDFGGGGGRGDAGSVPTLPLTICWRTALPVRQAMVKSRWGAEAATSAEAARVLGAPGSMYVIAITGLPGRMLMAMPAERLKSTSMLRMGKRPPVYAAEVKVSAAGQPVADVYLFFPRTLNGAEVITLDDKDVEVVSGIGNLEVKRKFRLKEMVFEGKLEL